MLNQIVRNRTVWSFNCVYLQNVFTNLALNNQQWLICHKTKANFTFLIIKVFPSLIFYHFFQNLVLKFYILRIMNLKKEVYFSSLVIILFHDSAWLYVIRKTLQMLTNFGCETLPNPPYTPDHSPTDYNFFKRLDTFYNQKDSVPKEKLKLNLECYCTSIKTLLIDGRNV